MYTSVQDFLNARDSLLVKTAVLFSIGKGEFTPEELELAKVYRANLASLDSAYTEATVGDAILPELTLPQMAKYIYPDRFVKKTVQETVVEATQQRLDTFAATRNYDGILSACTYATSTIAQFAAEGQAAVNARDTTWSTLYTILGKIQAGTYPMPTGFSDIEPDLPVLAWPA